MTTAAAGASGWARPKFRVADFFSGCGGTSAGLRAAGFHVAFGTDFDSDASTTYRLNFPEAQFIERDIRKVKVEEVRVALGGQAAPLLVSACAPCQPYSSYVGTAGQDKRRTLLLALRPFIEDLMPDYLLVENVPGLKSQAAAAGTFSRFCKYLRLLGYSVVSDVLDCQFFGVPQRRRRLVIIASRHGPVDLPLPTHGLKTDNSISTVADWLQGLPSLGHGETHPEVPNHVASALSPLNLERMRATPPGGGRADWPAQLVLDCHQDHRGHSDVYGRMRWDAPAPVLTTKCTSISNGRFGHPTEDRPISVREAACLQTFPRDFVFHGGIKTTTRQVGNAVPVLFAQALGKAILEHAVVHCPTYQSRGAFPHSASRVIAR